jgi:hypothetical protein
MALQVDRKALDGFCLELFRTLDGLGLLPLQLWEKPNEFEKYSRLLFGSIQRYNDVEAGFKEWESRVLRDAPHRREEYYPKLDALRQQMAQDAQMFTKKANMQHLRTSLYARVFQFLYPRRVLANAYCAKHQGDVSAIEPKTLELEFPASVKDEVYKLQETYGDEWEDIIADARSSLTANAAYYRKVLIGKTTIVPPKESDQAVVEELNNEPQEG